MSGAEQGHYKITWLSNAVMAEGYKRSIALGICEYSKKIAFAALSDDILTLMGVHDLYIENGVCEEGRRCLCNSCPYNRTTATSLGTSSKQWSGIRSNQLKRIRQRSVKIEELLKKRIDSINWHEKQIIIHFEKVPIKVSPS
jgi:hypothetical protein